MTPITHAVVRASAGTGKTFNLSSRYLALLGLDAAPNTILAATFTRQAFVEFDLESIFSAEDQSGYADFFLLWLTCHRTRFAPVGGGHAVLHGRGLRRHGPRAPHPRCLILTWPPSDRGRRAPPLPERPT